MQYTCVDWKHLCGYPFSTPFGGVFVVTCAVDLCGGFYVVICAVYLCGGVYIVTCGVHLCGGVYLQYICVEVFT